MEWFWNANTEAYAPATVDGAVSHPLGINSAMSSAEASYSLFGRHRYLHHLRPPDDSTGSIGHTNSSTSVPTPFIRDELTSSPLLSSTASGLPFPVGNGVVDLLPGQGEVQHWFYTLLSVTGLLIAVPNGVIVALAIQILLRKRRSGGVLRGLKAQYCYIASLAGSDMLVGLVTFVIFMTRVQDNIVLCQVKISLTITSGLASILHTLLIAVDRYLYLIHGLTYHQTVRRSRIIAATAAAWAASAVIGFAPLLVVGVQHRRSAASSGADNESSRWLGRCYYVEVVPPAYAVFIEAFYVVCGLVPTSALYVRIVRASVRQRGAVELETASTTARLLGTASTTTTTAMTTATTGSSSTSSTAAAAAAAKMKESPFRFDDVTTAARRFPTRDQDVAIRAKHVVKPLKRNESNQQHKKILSVIMEEESSSTTGAAMSKKPHHLPPLILPKVNGSSLGPPMSTMIPAGTEPSSTCPRLTTTTTSSPTPTAADAGSTTGPGDDDHGRASSGGNGGKDGRKRKITALLPLMLKPLRPAQRFGVEKRAVTAILLLVVSFAAAWLPHAGAVLAYHAGVCGDSAACRAQLAAKITSVFFFVGSLNSLLNPFIYTWGFKELRTYVVNFLRCRGGPSACCGGGSKVLYSDSLRLKPAASRGGRRKTNLVTVETPAAVFGKS